MASCCSSVSSQGSNTNFMALNVLSLRKTARVSFCLITLLAAGLRALSTMWTFIPHALGPRCLVLTPVGQALIIAKVARPVIVAVNVFILNLASRHVVCGVSVIDPATWPEQKARDAERNCGVY